MRVKGGEKDIVSEQTGHKLKYSKKGTKETRRDNRGCTTIEQKMERKGGRERRRDGLL